MLKHRILHWLVEDLARQGVASHLSQFQGFAHSTYSRMIGRGASIAPHKTLPDLVKWAKANEPVTATVSTKGASVDITLLLFAKAAGFKLTTVPGSGGADALTKFVGGHEPIGGQHPSEVLPHFKADRLRGLAVAFDKRDPSVPDIPTFKEFNYDVGYRLGVPAPGYYHAALNSDSSLYGGSNAGNSGGVHSEALPWMGQPHSVTRTLPPLAGVLLKM